MSNPASNRRDFLSGRSVIKTVENAGQALADELIAEHIPSRGPTLLLRTTAMACDFDVILNPDKSSTQVEAASSALDLVHELEQQLSVYRPDSDLSELNRKAFHEPVVAKPEMFDLLARANQFSELTNGAFDPASGALIHLWRRCRQESRIPTEAEIEWALFRCGMSHVQFDASTKSIAFLREGLEFNLGAIGKGYAVDRACESLTAAGVANRLVHGGRSSIRAAGTHAGHEGWPVGLRNPLLPEKPFGTLLLRDAALATSGTAVQWFRHEGKRYGHILDPRSGWPIETLLSVSVIAPDSAMADALSTAFFVLGVEKSRICCDNLNNTVGAIFFPLPRQGQTLEPILHNVSPDIWFVT